ncbi:MAG: saccharopine dehydrogenase NADP-binding domain-containing protein [Myxococcaceae bacterium]|nr:saccharopine dehydrogenase NADP-binding domain-containing protein [Myxococcaceae bacterium]
MERRFDLVVFGATGFTGRLVAEELARVAPKSMRWAIAGRSKDKLEAVRRGLARDCEVLIADSAHPEELARSARVVCTTVGPYLQHGLPLVKACAEAGTHLADLTGELLFIKDSIETADAAAMASGARIVHGCGFDSIPSDLGVRLLHEHLARAGQGGKLGQVSLYVEKLKGGFSGGTIASLEGMLVEAARDRARRKVLLDPHALSPEPAAEQREERDLTSVKFDPVIGQWTAPFVMASVNTRVVRRTHALLGRVYGKGFRYREVSSTGKGPAGLARAVTLTSVLGGAVGALAMPWSRALMHRVLPAPGEGPSAEARAAGGFRYRFVAQLDGGGTAEARFHGSGDPGYAATSRMLAQASLALAFDELPRASGVLTPAVALGTGFMRRLEAHGFRFEA